MKPSSFHALRVLEYDRIREILTSYASSSLGRACAGSLRPLGSLEEAKRRLDETEEMRALLKQARMPLSGLRDVVGETRAGAEQGRSIDPAELYNVVDLLTAARSVRDTIERHASALPELSRLTEGLNDLPELREEIAAKVDPREGVRDGATERLGAIRARIRELRASLRTRATAILSNGRLRVAFQSGGLTIKGDRYLVPVKAEYRSWVRGPVRDRSQSGATLYIEPEEITFEGDELLESLDAERNEVELVLWELTRKVAEARPVLERNQGVLSQVDFTHAKAVYADAFGLTSPVLDPGEVLELRDVRHPYLLWLARDERCGIREIDLDSVRSRVVPISVRLGEDFRILVVTGPNTGGKTVALKTIGLNVLMALSGVPVAAEPGSRVPWYRRVFADIGDEQSIEQSLSTFSSHLSQIIDVLRRADGESLILLDELGSGTDPLEGAALGRALLDVFLARGWRAIITTHIGSLKEHAYSREGVENAAMEFNPQTLRPTYRLLLGIPGSSNALAIARRMGLEPEVLDAAEREVTQVREPTREIISRMEKSRRRVEKERRRAERTRRRAQADARTYRERLEEVETLKQALEQEAQLVVDNSVREVKLRIEPLLEHLKNVPKTHRQLVDKLTDVVNELLVGTPLGEKREEFARSLRKDDTVYVPKFRDAAKVRKIDKGNRKLTVLWNGIPTEISFDDVSWVDKPTDGAS